MGERRVHIAFRGSAAGKAAIAERARVLSEHTGRDVDASQMTRHLLDYALKNMPPLHVPKDGVL